MIASRQTWLVLFDVFDDKRRYRLVRCLAAQGVRVQRSVFECDLSAWERQQLAHAVAQLIDPARDRVVFYPMSRNGEARIAHFGTQRAHAPSGEGAAYVIA